MREDIHEKVFVSENAMFPYAQSARQTYHTHGA